MYISVYNRNVMRERLFGSKILVQAHPMIDTVYTCTGTPDDTVYTCTGTPNDRYRLNVI